MEAKVSEILENVLSMLSLEGSFEVEEKEEGIFVTIELEDPGKLIGHQGETLSSLQLLVNQMVARQMETEGKKADKESGYESTQGVSSIVAQKQSGTVPQYKRVIVDIAGWRQSKEEDLAHRARAWAQQVIKDKQVMELPPMPAWQRRIIHMTVNGTEGVKSESVGEGQDRHLVISPDEQESAK